MNDVVVSIGCCDGRNNAGGFYMEDSLSGYKGFNFRKAREGWELWKRLAWREQMPWDGEWKVGRITADQTYLEAFTSAP